MFSTLTSHRGLLTAGSAALIAASTSVVVTTATEANATTAAASSERVATKGTRNTIGALPSSPSLGLYPHVDAIDNFIVAVAGPKGADAEVQNTATAGELWFARLDDAPSKVEGLAGVPTWAHPHFGTDANGRTVVVYPRCSDGLIRDCDLYAWDVRGNTERKLTEVSTDTAGELEGTMTRGTIAWTTANAAQLAESAAPGPRPGRTLRLRTRAGKTGTLTTRGGYRLALRADGTVAQVVQASAEPTWRVELVRGSGKRTALHTYGESAAPRNAVGLRFFGDELRFAMASQDRAGASLWRVPLSRPAKRTSVRAAAAFTSFAFARRDVLVWIGNGSGESTSPLLSDFLPKRLR